MVKQKNEYLISNDKVYLYAREKQDFRELSVTPDDLYCKINSLIISGHLGYDNRRMEKEMIPFDYDLEQEVKAFIFPIFDKGIEGFVRVGIDINDSHIVNKFNDLVQPLKTTMKEKIVKLVVYGGLAIMFLTASAKIVHEAIKNDNKSFKVKIEKWQKTDEYNEVMNPDSSYYNHIKKNR